MTVITIQVPDDLAPNQNKEREYDVAFVLVRKSRTARHGSAKFHIFSIWDENGDNVLGGDFIRIGAHAYECYYEEMLAAVDEGG